MIATPLRAIGTKISDLVILNRNPITAGALPSDYTGAVLVVPSAVALPAEQQWPQSIPASGQLVFGGAPANRRVFRFAHYHATAAAGTTSEVIIYGLRMVTALDADSGDPHGTVPGSHFEIEQIPLVKATLTAGANLIPTTSRIFRRTGGVGQIAWVEGDGIVVDEDYTRNASALVYHAAADSAGALEIDGEGFERYMLQFAPGSGVGVYAGYYDL